jgi:hypothetical protein
MSALERRGRHDKKHRMDSAGCHRGFGLSCPVLRERFRVNEESEWEKNKEEKKETKSKASGEEEDPAAKFRGESRSR